MIVKSSMVIFILSYALISVVIGASYSSVYVGSDVIPVEYAQYGVPYTSIVNPRLSRINALPPVSGYVSPCGSPCVYPSQTIASVTPVINPNANILTYKTAEPSVPIVVTPTKEEPTGYEYSYVVYDENTGDHKAQRELSDGSVVRGEYSFLQPDGYVREVQYVADDVSGFNAVVKNFLPIAVEGKGKGDVNSKKESSPCHEVKNESLKEESAEDVNKSTDKEESKQQNKDVIISEESKDSGEQSKEKLKVEPEIESQEVKKEEESAKKPGDEAKSSTEVSKEKSGEKSKEDQEKPENSKEESGEETSEEPKEKKNIKINNSKEESGEESKEKKSKKESGVESNEEQKNKDSGEDSASAEEVKVESKESKENDNEKSKKEFKESSESEESYERLTQSKNKEAHELFLQPEREVQVPYKDILRCIQAAIKRANGVPSVLREDASPLTYIILNKPC